MRMRPFIPIACLLLSGAPLRAADAPAGKPNILILVADDLGWADVGWHGGKFKTPVMDRLAREGVDLDRHYVQPVCTPTRTALLSGRWTSRFGPHVLAPSNSRAFPPGTPTLASALRECGYATFISGKWHLGGKMEWGPNHYGFDHSYGALCGAVDPWTHKYRPGPYEDTWHRDLRRMDEEGNATELVAREALGWIRRKQEPWFIYVPFFAVHIPVDAPEEYKRLYAGAKFDDDPAKNDSLLRLGAYVAQLDAKVGELVAALEETGQRRDTLILFTSDNGGLPGGKNPYVGKVADSPALSSNLPLRGHKGTLYEGGVRVSAFVNWPGRLAPRRLEAPIHAADWMPTLTKLAGWRPPADLKFDGLDVWPSLTGEVEKPAPRTIYIPHPSGAIVLRDGWKLIARKGAKKREASVELYNVIEDPLEKRDLAAAEPGRVKELEELLASLRAGDLEKMPPDAGDGVVDKAEKTEKPNILLVLSDDHSAPHVGCYGNPDVKTPNLDRFAAQGMRFDRAYVTCPQCVPSRASIFAGRSPVAIDMTRFSAPLPRDVVTYPEVLRAAGWFTGVAGRTYHMDGAAGSPESRAVFEKYKLATFRDRLDYVKTAGENGASLVQFREFLDRRPKDRSFFLQLCSNDPHRPLTTSGPEKHDPARIRLPAHHPDTKLVREDFARYYDEIAHFDVFFGEVLAELDRRGLSGNTLVAFMGDNGCSQFRGKGTLYELGIRVPLLVRWNGKVKPGSSTGALVSGEDLAPTFLEAAGLPAPREMTGKSFVKLLRGEPFEGRRYVFAERGAHGGNSLPQNSSAFDLGRVVVSPTHKLIYTATWQLPYHPVDFAGTPFWKELERMHREGRLDAKLERLYFSPTRPMFELYDLQKDPSELDDLAGRPEAAAVEKELKAALQEWMILQRDFVPLPVTAEAKGNAKGQARKKRRGSL